MVIRGLIVALALCASGLLAGCKGDGKETPFEGDWASATAGRLSFDGDEWSDGDGDSGEFSVSGKYPVYTVVFRSGAGQITKVATFADERTFELCSVDAGGALVDCHDFAYDQPTLH